MNALYMRAMVVFAVLMIAVVGNAYLYLERQQSGAHRLDVEQQLLQKTAVIKMANQPAKSSPVGHRLGLPCSRMAAGEDFQKLSQSLKLGRLDFQISPETAVGEVFSESTVDLKFQNAYDQPLFHLITQIIDAFPGLVYPVEIVMWRDLEQSQPLVTGSFRFQWLKLREEES